MACVTVLVMFVNVLEMIPGFGAPGVGCWKNAIASLPFGVRPSETSVVCGPYSTRSITPASDAEADQSDIGGKFEIQMPGIAAAVRRVSRETLRPQ